MSTKSASVTMVEGKAEDDAQPVGAYGENYSQCAAQGQVATGR